MMLYTAQGSQLANCILRLLNQWLYLRCHFQTTVAESFGFQ